MGVLRHHCSRILQALGRSNQAVDTLFGYSVEKTNESRKGRVTGR